MKRMKLTKLSSYRMNHSNLCHIMSWMNASCAFILLVFSIIAVCLSKRTNISCEWFSSFLFFFSFSSHFVHISFTFGLFELLIVCMFSNRRMSRKRKGATIQKTAAVERMNACIFTPYAVVFVLLYCYCVLRTRLGKKDPILKWWARRRESEWLKRGIKKDSCSLSCEVVTMRHITHMCLLLYIELATKCNTLSLALPHTHNHTFKHIFVLFTLLAYTWPIYVWFWIERVRLAKVRVKQQ